MAIDRPARRRIWMSRGDSALSGRGADRRARLRLAVAVVAIATAAGLVDGVVEAVVERDDEAARLGALHAR